MTISVADVLRGTKVVLLDFDGPIAALFGGVSATAAIEELTAIAAAHGYDITAEGPPQFVQKVSQLGDEELLHAITDAARDAEVRAAASAVPTPGARAVMRAARETGRRVAIVSNNAPAAVSAYLDRHDLGQDVDLVVGRHDGLAPRLMKPHPYLLTLALTSLGVPAEAGAFIGDSVSDIEAGRAAGVAAIGYANKPGKRERLSAAGAHAVIETMTDLADALHAAVGSA
ncbi:HAD family hydrolase [Dactylosporangium roseum]|uniref:HAD family hydrolase n=1 Tax=Dactylosporangium roseum TaxID=47989 RepID=A0ABY5Z3V6_9ACTN|nr:HAD family hydrolase [Dactylosporangium roseum]UWZ35745.1 HAD family hydrolase [Dactylosporangium roseum]